MGAAAKFSLHPFNALLGIVLRVSKEIIKFPPAERLHDAVFPSAFGKVEVVADQFRQLLQARLVHRRLAPGQVLALAPIGSVSA